MAYLHLAGFINIYLPTFHGLIRFCAWLDIICIYGWMDGQMGQHGRTQTADSWLLTACCAAHTQHCLLATSSHVQSNVQLVSTTNTTMNTLRSTVKLASRGLNQRVQKRHGSGAAAPEWTGVDKIIRDKFPEDWQGQLLTKQVHCIGHLVKNVGRVGHGNSGIRVYRLM